MKIAIYDPEPLANSYLTIKYFEPLLKYGKDNGRDISKIDSFDNVKNSSVLAESRFYTPEIIVRLKNNGNKVILFDINDSSYINQITKLGDIDLIFKFSGIQQTRESNELRISDQFEYSVQERYFMPDEAEWNMYVLLRDTDRLVSMPYAPFYHCDVEHIPYENKKKKAVIRGGNHYIRYHLFLMLLKHGLINKDSAFTTSVYFTKQMDKFRIFCPDCRDAFEKYGKLSYDYYKSRPRWGCNNPFMDWQVEELEDGFFQNSQTHRWNNRCVPSFYRLTQEFEKYHGAVNWALVENALSSDFLKDKDFYEVIKLNLLYGDYKWLFSVDIPPRFWQGVNAKTINLLPAWTKNQKQFPELKDGEHYISFNEDLSGLESIADITKEQHDHITNNCFELYNKYIKCDKYLAATGLMDYVFENLERIN